MKTIYVLAIAIAFQGQFAIAQKNALQSYLTTLPKDLKLIEKEPQKYRITADYFNGDIFGNFINKTRVTGNYTRGFKNGTVRWKDVRIANGNTRESQFENAALQEYMENFSYTPSDKMLEAASYDAFPPNSFHAKNLVWDMLAIENFAWTHFDSLKLNKTFRPSHMENEISLSDEGTFQNKDIQLMWTGVSSMNGEICALIDYRTMDNPLVIDTEQIKIKGRSHYWGTIWVSLTDKQIEHATLYEDVVMDMSFNHQPSQLLNSTRVIHFEKLN